MLLGLRLDVRGLEAAVVAGDQRLWRAQEGEELLAGTIALIERERVSLGVIAVGADEINVARGQQRLQLAGLAAAARGRSRWRGQRHVQVPRGKSLVGLRAAHVAVGDDELGIGFALGIRSRLNRQQIGRERPVRLFPVMHDAQGISRRDDFPQRPCRGGGAFA